MTQRAWSRAPTRTHLIRPGRGTSIWNECSSLVPTTVVVRMAVDRHPQRHFEGAAALCALLHAVIHFDPPTSLPPSLDCGDGESLRRLPHSQLWPPLVFPDPKALGVELQRSCAIGR